jgi:hypothetical protein
MGHYIGKRTNAEAKYQPSNFKRPNKLKPHNYPAWRQPCEPQAPLHASGATPFTTAGGVLKIVSNSNEPQLGQAICFSDFAFIDAEILCSLLQSVQRKS